MSGKGKIGLFEGFSPEYRAKAAFGQDDVSVSDQSGRASDGGWRIADSG